MDTREQLMDLEARGNVFSANVEDEFELTEEQMQDVEGGSLSLTIFLTTRLLRCGL